jgi:hypothetical protein
MYLGSGSEGIFPCRSDPSEVGGDWRMGWSDGGRREQWCGVSGLLTAVLVESFRGFTQTSEGCWPVGEVAARSGAEPEVPEERGREPE